jgi:crotonobetainyl-CoA:carnitine CoA-transferase CaiB-like acyl-CoA transferase
VPAPTLGGDSVAILREIGYDPTEIDEMTAAHTTIDGRPQFVER